MPNVILGVSCYYHDSAAALLVDGEIISAAQEERFSRVKHDNSFPKHAIQNALNDAGIGAREVSVLAFYDKPLLKFERILETYHSYAPKGIISFLRAMPVWLKEKAFMRRMLKKEMEQFTSHAYQVVFPEHHLSHAASAFYPSPFEQASILTIDGVGEWATTTIGVGKGSSIEIIKELDFPHSLGLLYSSFTYYCGFKVNSGEYKLMGLAPYGSKESLQTKKFKQFILDELIDIREDGSFLLNMDYFNFAVGFTMCNEKKWEKLFEFPRRHPESALEQKYMDLALAIQEITEDIVLKLARTTKKITGESKLVMAGGVALNCVANGKILREKVFDDIWIQPAAGDAGGALGAALAAWYIGMGNERKVEGTEIDKMSGSYLGPEFYFQDILKIVKKFRCPFRRVPDQNELCDTVAELLSKNFIIGWFQGRMEFGPRALGNRSILANPCDKDMQRKLNLKIKYREGFRPFAPSVAEEDTQQYFDLNSKSPYMLLVAPVKSNRCKSASHECEKDDILKRLYDIRSDIPAVTHIDYSARIQTVSKATNQLFWMLLESFKKYSGCSVLINTSFNVRGEPIVCTPNDAYLCFMRTEMDYLVINDCIFTKTEQVPIKEDRDWRLVYQLD